MPPLRILVVDDHAIMRRGIRSLLECHEGWQVCGEASTGRDAVEQSRRLHPDLVVMDMSLPELNGLDATRLILKDALITAVDTLRQHKPFLTATETEFVWGEYVRRRDAGHDDAKEATLTAREREIIRLIAEGQSNKQHHEEAAPSIGQRSRALRDSQQDRAGLILFGAWALTRQGRSCQYRVHEIHDAILVRRTHGGSRDWLRVQDGSA